MFKQKNVTVEQRKGNEERWGQFLATAPALQSSGQTVPSWLSDFEELRA